METKTKATFNRVLDKHIDSEWQKNVGNLLKYFCQNIFLGQWELAATAVPTLIKEFNNRKSNINTTFVQILLNVTDYPFSQSLGSTAVPSPHHLSWLCLLELRKFADCLSDAQKVLVERLVKDVDFRLTLTRLKGEDEASVKELYVFFKKHVLGQKTPLVKSDFGGGDFLSEGAVDFLRKIVLSDPSLGDNVLRSLMTERNTEENKHNELLNAIYLDCIDYWIDKVEDESRRNPQSGEITHCTENSLQILAVYNPQPYWNYLRVRQVFAKLLTLAINKSVPELTLERITSVLCGRQLPYLVDEFCKIYQEVLAAKSESEHGDVLTSGQWLSLHMLSQVDRNLCWRDFFILCYRKGVHFLGEILDLSLALVRAGDFITLQDMLSYLELQPLKPAVLLMGWSCCTTSADARTLLDTLWDDSADCFNSSLASGCRRLAYHLDLIQWCLDRSRSLKQNSDSKPTGEASELLRGLEMSSVLLMLHRSTSLESLDHSEVLRLLTSTSASKKKGNRKKVVTFQDQSKSTKAAPEPINIDQQKDIAIYRSYCALKNVMDSLMFCVDNFDHGLMNPIQVKKMLREKKLHRNFNTDQSVSSSEGEDSSTGLEMSPSVRDKAKEKEDAEYFLKQYDLMVTRKLTETLEHLSHLQPLNYRLEVLEDIFSLLFVTHEDLSDISSVADLETDDDNDSNKRSSSDNLHPDSLVMSDDDVIRDDLSSEQLSFEPKVQDNAATSSRPSAPDSKRKILDYDVPFEDLHQKRHDSPPLAELPKSAYFTPNPELQKKATETANNLAYKTVVVTNTNEDHMLPVKRSKKKKKRRDSEPSPDRIVGFLGNEYIVRDILYLLKDAIADLNIAKFVLTGKTTDMAKKEATRNMAMSKSISPDMDPTLEAALQTHVPSSIPPEVLSNRITKLTQAVHEAWWRFQLLAHEAFPRQPYQVLQEKVFVTDSDIDFLPVCEGKAFSFDTDGDPYLTSSETRSRAAISQSGILSKMSASPESLLVHCLLRNKPVQAAEVMKLFRLTDKTAETCEVTFSEVYQLTCGQIWDLEPEARASAQTQVKVGQRSITALNKAASVGVATAHLSNIVEDLLVNSCVPPVPKPRSLKEYFSTFFNLDPSSVILCDLLCTSCRTWDACSNMFDIIKTKTKLLKHDPRQRDHVTSLLHSSQAADLKPSLLPGLPYSINSKTKPPKAFLQGILGVTEMLWNLYDVIHAGDAKAAYVGTRASSPAARVGLQHHFHSCGSSFRVENIQSLETALAELRKTLVHTQQVLGGVSSENPVEIGVEDSIISSHSPSPRGSSSGSLSGSVNSQGGSTGTKPRSRPHADHNPLHIAVKQLMQVMEKYVPGDGLTQIILGKSGKTGSPPLKNFLLSLYEHVKEMSFLVVECEGKNTEVASNYFKVLNEGPISILGRLMFVKRMPPARLEAVAQKLSLNLTHTIVHSCCPKIPSKHPPPVPECGADISIRLPGTRVYNIQKLSGSQSDKKTPNIQLQSGTTAHPEVLVRETLTSLIRLLGEIAARQNAVGLFDLSCAKMLVRLPEWRKVLNETLRLKEVDLDQLTSREERLCFFNNLINLMILHCHFCHIETQLQLYPAQDKTEFSCDDELVELCPLRAADYISHFSSFSYEVGQLGVVSIFDLLTAVSGQDLANSCQWNNILNCRKLELSPEDPCQMFSPPSDPRTIFVLNFGCLSSPPLQVLQPDQVMSQLETSTRDYLNHTVQISLEHKRVLLPELLIWHELNFVGETESSTETRHLALAKWASQYLGEEKQKMFQQLVNVDSGQVHNDHLDASLSTEATCHIETDLFDNGFSVALDISYVKVGLINPPKAIANPQKTRFLMSRSSNSFERSSSRSWSLELPCYNLTPVTLEYVKQNSLLVATMVSLVCSDDLDNIEQHFMDDHFNQSEPASVSGSVSGIFSSPLRPQHSDISLVDIRSYRYHRLTDDYPILQRHLLHYILPLAGADNPDLLTSAEPILKFVTNEIDDQVKLCMFSLPCSNQFQSVVQDMANRLLEEHKWLEILNILESLPESLVGDKLHLQTLHDFVLSCWAVSQVVKPGFAPKVGDQLRKFYSVSLQARTVLSLYRLLPLDLSLDLLDLCLTLVDKKSRLWKAVQARYQEIAVYSKIMDCVKSMRIKLSMKDVPILSLTPEEQTLHKLLEQFMDWRLIPQASQQRPRDVLAVLEKAADFNTARTWARIHKLPQNIGQEIEERHLLHLLTLDQSDTVTAFRLLDGLRVASEPRCLSVCQNLLGHLTRPQNIKFVVGYMLEFLARDLEPEDAENLRLTRIGAKALMCIPHQSRGEYNHLISCPHLILEQLLMNMKAELAGQIFEKIKLDFLEIKEPKRRLVQDQFNQLLTSYAHKAIEVNVVQVDAETTGLTSLGRPDDSDLPTDSPSKKFPLDRRKNDPSASPATSLTTRGDLASKSLARFRNEGDKFVTPLQPPSQDQWVPDGATSVCMVCKVERFSMFSRRHHCRRCGRVVCAACSTKQVAVAGVLARACDECYEQIHSSSDHKVQEELEIYSRKIKEQLTGTSVGSKMVSSASSGTNSSLSSDRLKHSLTSAIHHVNHTWKFQSDGVSSEEVRSEFYYEQAPSVSLCISLLKQLSSQGEAGKLILSMCDQLSTYLVPISPGVPNPEIDYSLIISVMKQLLFQAKLNFLHTGHSGMTEMCELYLARVDLLDVMVRANYQDLPTIKELTKQDSVRRLRDKLIADERLPLAMEVSTKCGLDPAGVWSAMGFACLHMGDFSGAREKFARCLKVPADKNQAPSGQGRLLTDILEFLDTVPSTGYTEVQRLLTDPGSICDIKTLLIPSVGEENRTESVPYQECLFYLRTYGNYMDHICFLRQHSYWMKAVQFAVDHLCSSDIFVQGLMVPAMTSGEMGRLLEQMLMLDPTLEKWNSYLTATCKHLLKHKYHNTMYQVQLFMKDYIRAAMTCITHFYQRGATSYLDLCGRLQFLYTAQLHLQAYLDPGQWGSVRHPLAVHTPTFAGKLAPSWEKPTPESAARMTLSPEEVKKHIRTIGLQIEVTKFMEQCLTQSQGAGPLAASLLPRASPQIPTLFGPGAARTELVSMVVLSGNDISVGFDLAVRIVKECRLNPTVIFTHCSRELAKQSRFSEIGSMIESLIHERLVDDDGIDEIVGASLLVIADSHSQAQDESEALIQLLRNDSNKINAFILCGKLRSAYLLAVKRDRVDDVQRIAGAAQRLGQSAVKNICKKWLEQHQK